MPKMRNISQRQFVIAGKTLKQGETGEFAQSVIDRHVASYAGELIRVGEIGIDIKVDAEEVSKEIEALKIDPELTEEKVEEFIDGIEFETTVSEEEVKVEVVAPKKRGRQPKAK